MARGPPWRRRLPQVGRAGPQGGGGEPAAREDPLMDGARQPPMRRDLPRFTQLRFTQRAACSGISKSKADGLSIRKPGSDGLVDPAGPLPHNFGILVLFAVTAVAGFTGSGALCPLLRVGEAHDRKKGIRVVGRMGIRKEPHGATDSRRQSSAACSGTVAGFRTSGSSQGLETGPRRKLSRLRNIRRKTKNPARICEFSWC